MTEVDSPLEIEALSGGYEGPRVLHSISLGVGVGQVAALLGPNGAGKSSILRAVMGLLPKAEGHVRVHGKSVLGVRTNKIAKMRVAYIPEGRGVLNSLTVWENLQLGASLSAETGTTSDVIERATARFPVLRERFHLPAGQLSGGQQQMLVIARALATSPLLLLVDEPSLGLAPILRQDVAEVLRRLAEEEGLTVLLAEQDVTMASSSDVVFLMRHGRLVSRLSSEVLSDIDALRDVYLGGAQPAVATVTEDGTD